MSKVSKNIKRLRNEKKLTQQDLADKLHVTRQTVSSWETDRTQPDVEILGMLAEVFAVELEELIYGKRRRKDGEEKPSYNNTLIVVLSVIGCLLIAAGAVMIFVKYWKSFPGFVKLIFCFLPALCGQSLGVFTFLKKRDNVPWCEGSSVLWVIGVSASSYMLMHSSIYIFGYNEGVFSIISGCLLFGILPLLKSFSPIIAFFGYAFTGFYHRFDNMSFNVGDETNSADDIKEFVLITAAYLTLMTTGLVISSRFFKKEDNVTRYTFFIWLQFAVISALPVMPLSYLNLFTYAPTIVAVFAACYFFIGGTHKDFFSPYKFFSLPVSAFILSFFGTGIGMGFNDLSSVKTCIIFCALSLLPLAFLCFKKTKPQERVFTAYGLLLCLGNLFYSVNGCLLLYYSKKIPEGQPLPFVFTVMQWFTFIFTMSALVTLIIYGAKQRRLYFMNLGFIGACTVIIARLAMLRLGLIGTGLLLIVSGAGLLMLDLRFAKLKKKEEEEKLLLSQKNDEEVSQ